ncbi:MAG: glutamine--fructose-6-phosphate transaminase (isomerizing) [Haloferacaceae archaeon]
MCGIIAHIGGDDAPATVLRGLKNLEYRGYDSAGIAVRSDDGLTVRKREGRLERLRDAIDEPALSGRAAIGHTRWSTHGPPTDENAHPHTDCSGAVAVVHNGIIENYDELRAELRNRGHEFTSGTDTEVIPHLIEDQLDRGRDPDRAFRRTVERLEGSFAVAALLDGEERLYATRRGSPLVLGLGDGEFYLASDVPAFLESTDRVVFLEDGDVVAVGADGYDLTDDDGAAVDRPVEQVDWHPEDAQKGRFPHFMLKEIHEQPSALRQTLEGRVDAATGHATVEDVSLGDVGDVSRVQFVGCGTSYHAALCGVTMLGDRGVPSQAFLASEYTTTAPPIPPGTLVVAVTQSGETADTLEALRRANRAGARTLALTNVVGSTATREADETMFIRAGPEIGVAATKTFSSQVASLLVFADWFENGGGVENWDLTDSLDRLPEYVDQILVESNAEDIAARYLDSASYVFVGRGIGYPVALEGALKFKEITYEHAEGFPAGELKHGPLALVTPETPVVAICPGAHEQKMVDNIHEIKARGSPVIAIAREDATAVRRQADEVLAIPSTRADVGAVLANVHLQLFAYHSADALGRSIDKPRNLAKSVTVE